MGYTRGDSNPKMHMMQELIEYQYVSGGSPAKVWNYTYEDFMGRIAEMAHRRGGPSHAIAIAEDVLNKFSSLESL